MINQRIDADTSCCRRANNSRPCQARMIETPTDICFDQLDLLCAHLVALGQNHNSRWNVHYFENVKMLLCLWHPSFVGIHNQHHDVHCIDTRNHRANEINVARHINETQRDTIGCDAVCKPKIDGHAFALFFGQSIRICSGENADE